MESKVSEVTKRSVDHLNQIHVRHVVVSALASGGQVE